MLPRKDDREFVTRPTSNGRLLDKPLPPLASCIALRRGLVTPVVSIAAMVVTVLGVPFSILLYLTVPFIEGGMDRSCRRL